MTSLKAYLATTTVFCGLFASAAFAQQSTTPSDTIEVVVTAQKRTERLKDMTVSASVVDDNALSRANATDISDLNKIVPSVQLKGSFNGRVPMSMRGISTNANEAAIGLTSGVSILVDGVPVSSDSMGANQLADVERVEVLKGPQSTLGGRAASAGVINIVTRKPSKTFQGDGSVLVTDDQQNHIEAFVSGPLDDKVAGSLSLFNDHTRYPMQNLATGKYTTTDGAGARAKLLIRPTDDLDITLAARHGYMISHGNNFVYNYITPDASLLGIPAPFMSQDVNLAGYDPRDFKNTKYDSISGARSRVRDTDYSVNIDWRVGDYTLTSTTASQTENQYMIQDVPIVATYFFDVLTGGNAPHYGNSQEITLGVQTTSQEFKITSPLDRPVNFVAGLFWSETDVTSHNNRTWVANPFINTVNSDTKTLGLYARVNWALGADWKLITGLRANQDDVAYSIDQIANNAEGAFYSSARHKSSNLVGDLTLQRKLGENAQIYGTYSRGYKPAAYNTAAQLKSNAALTPVEPEEIDHFEIGSKGVYADRTLTLNAALFHTQYKNYQIQVFDTGSAWPAPFILSNAAEAKTEGLELDAAWRATPSLSFALNAAFIDARFETYTGAPCYNSQTVATGCLIDSGGIQSQDLSGKSMPDAPKAKVNVSFDKRFTMSSGPFDYQLAGSYAWRSKANLQANQNPETVQDAFGILNLSLTAHSHSGQYSISLLVNNVTDQYYVTNLEDFFSGIWGGYDAAGNGPANGIFGNAVISQPARDSHRYVGVRLNAAF